MAKSKNKKPPAGKHAKRKDSEGANASQGANSSAAPNPTVVESRPNGWRFAPFWCSLLGGLLFLLSFPPFGCWPLVFLAPTPWVWLVRQPKLTGPRPYLWIWLGAALAWLALLQGIRLPHWILYIGWFALSFYAASYVPLFIAVARVAVLDRKWPLIVVAPIVWVGLEYLRGFFATGFSVGLIGHPLTPWTSLIQVADLGGAYAVSLVVMIVASSLARAAPTRAEPIRPWPLIPLVAALGASWLYGNFRLNRLPPQVVKKGVQVCLLQSNQDVVFVADEQRNKDLFSQCLKQAVRAKREHPGVRLIVWPESTFTANKRDLQTDGVPRPPVEIKITRERLYQALEWAKQDFQTHSRLAAEAIHNATRVSDDRPFAEEDANSVKKSEQDIQELPKGAANGPAPPGDVAETWQLVGTVTERFGDHEPERLNTALLMDHLGEAHARYYKTHRVMFGEYVPIGDQIPWIYRWTPMQRGLTAGNEPIGFEIDGVRFAPLICFETTVPHLVRRHFNQLASQELTPDVLLNPTNDGWFWGSSILDLHFACNVFRAVELRRPVLVSANTGLTSWLDDCGRVQQRSQRQTEDFLVDWVRPARVSWSIYSRIGDIPWFLCLLATLGVGAGRFLGPLVFTSPSSPRSP